MKKLVTLVLTFAFVLSFAIVSFASVTFDSSNGTGFVGKGDVQLALGYNNSQMQKKANDLNFTYETEEKYAVTEEWSTEGNKEVKVHEVTKKTTYVVNATVSYEARQRNQVNGFILLGFGTVAIDGEQPIVGETITVDPQTKNPYPTPHVVTGIELLSSTGGLYVNGLPLQ